MLIRSSPFLSILVILFSPLIWGQVSVNNVNTTKLSNVTTYSHSDTTYRIISSSANTYGYEILINGKAFIHQKNIPGLPGSTGFKRKEDAEKTAQLVLKKLTAGIMPPSIDKLELDSMKIKY
jgi:hypothetical protein